MERTLAMIKPEIVASNQAGAIIHRLENEGFRIIGMKMVRLTRAQAGEFYAVHRERPFYQSLIEYICSGRIIALVLERHDAVSYLRKVMGATDPAKAEPGTIRAEFGTNIEKNAIHGSDSPENAQKEISFFFSYAELVSLR